MRVAITGGNGFLGGALAKALGEAALLLPGEVRQPKTFASAASSNALVHFAALSSVPQSQRDPLTTWDVNVNGLLTLLEWARQVSYSGRVVLVSSAHVYGSPAVSPTPESTPVAPRSPYGASKAAAEALAMAYRASYGLDVVIVRPFNIYGPGQAPGFLVPDILGQLAKGVSMRLGDSTPVRDFLYIEDAVEFFRLLLAAKLPPSIVNLGSGLGASVREVAELAIRATGVHAECTFEEGKRRTGETLALVADVGLARKALGWAPKVALEDGLRKTWAAWPR